MIKYNEKSKKLLLKGAKQVYKAVAPTLGASGHAAIIKREMGHLVTKDGVTIAKEIYLNHPLQQLGADLIKEAARSADNISNDGTTTTTILTYQLMKRLLHNTTYNPHKVALGVRKASEDVVKALETMKVDTHDKLLKGVCNVSTNFDSSLSDVLYKAFKITGAEGSISLLTKGVKHSLVENKGFPLESPPDIRQMMGKASVEIDAEVLVSDLKVTGLRDFGEHTHNLVYDAWASGRTLALVVNDIDNHTMEAITVNNMGNKGNVWIFRLPDLGEISMQQLEDLSLICNTEKTSHPVNKDYPLGRCKILVKTDDVIFKFESTPKIAESIAKKKEYLKALKDAEVPDENVIIAVEQSLLRLELNSVRVFIGGTTFLEQKETLARAKDGLGSIKSALKSGVVIGGGRALGEASKLINTTVQYSDESEAWKFGYRVLLESITKPQEVVLKNAGLNKHLLSKCNSGTGINVLNGKIENFMKTGVVDSFETTKNGLEAAVSVACTVLLSHVAIAVPNSRGDNLF